MRFVERVYTNTWKMYGFIYSLLVVYIMAQFFCVVWVRFSHLVRWGEKNQKHHLNIVWNTPIGVCLCSWNVYWMGCTETYADKHTAKYMYICTCINFNCTMHTRSLRAFCQAIYKLILHFKRDATCSNANKLIFFQEMFCLPSVTEATFFHSENDWKRFKDVVNYFSIYFNRFDERHSSYDFRWFVQGIHWHVDIMKINIDIDHVRRNSWMVHLKTMFVAFK